MSSEMGLIYVCVLLLCWSISTNGANRAIMETYFVCEDVPPNQVAFNIIADGTPLTYSISGEDVSFFRVDPSDGTVYVKKALDRESKPVMKMDVTVTYNSGSLTSPIIIIINDANDHRPIFTASSYEKDVPENTAVGITLFKVEAFDGDTGNAGTVRYSIDESVPTSGLNVFRIDSLGNFILKEKLNYTSLSTFYRIKINASDSGGKCAGDEIVYLSSSVFAFITVVDVPDLDPRFIGIPYTASVEENTPNGHRVLTVTAVDQDTGINDKIIYSIQHATEEGLFHIDQEGDITVNSAIDREEIGDIVELTVKALKFGRMMEHTSLKYNRSSDKQ